MDWLDLLAVQGTLKSLLQHHSSKASILQCCAFLIVQPSHLHFHFSLSCTGEENGNPLQCSCLENPRDGGAWWAAVYGVAQSWTRLKRLSSSSKESEQNWGGGVGLTWVAQSHRRHGNGGLEKKTVTSRDTSQNKVQHDNWQCSVNSANRLLESY